MIGRSCKHWQICNQGSRNTDLKRSHSFLAHFVICIAQGRRHNGGIIHFFKRVIYVHVLFLSLPKASGTAELFPISLVLTRESVSTHPTQVLEIQTYHMRMNQFSQHLTCHSTTQGYCLLQHNSQVTRADFLSIAAG